MPKLFGIDIRGIVGQAIGSGLLPGKLHSASVSARAAGSMAGNTITYADHDFRGIVSSYNRVKYPSSNFIDGDGNLLLIDATVKPYVEVKAGDRITIDGTTYEIIDILSRDPASAAWTLHIRGI